VGGYVVTGRMLKMFRRRPTPPAVTTSSGDGSRSSGPGGG
jgi:hypothetical protein